MRKNGIVVLLKEHFLPCPLLALPLCSVMHLLWPTFALLCIEHVEIKGVLLLTLVVQKWGTEEVAAWLDLLHLGEYKETFLRHDVGGAELLHLERRDLKVFLMCHLLLLEVSLRNRVLPPVPLLLRAYSSAYVMQTCSNQICVVLWSKFLVCFLNKGISNVFLSKSFSY